MSHVTRLFTGGAVAAAALLAGANLTVTAGQLRPTGEQINKKTQTTLVSGTSGGIAGIGTPPATKAPPVGRVSWREITNYNDRH